MWKEILAKLQAGEYTREELEYWLRSDVALGAIANGFDEQVAFSENGQEHNVGFGMVGENNPHRLQSAALR